MINRILKLMEENHVTAKHLTSDLGLSGSAISEWKKGKGKPSTDAVVKIAKYFQVSADYILGIENSKQKKPAPTDGDGLSEKAQSFMTLVDGLTPDQQQLLLSQLQAWTEQNKRQAPAVQQSGGEKGLKSAP